MSIILDILAELITEAFVWLGAQARRRLTRPKPKTCERCGTALSPETGECSRCTSLTRESGI